MKLLNVLDKTVIGMKAIAAVITGFPVLATLGQTVPTTGRKVTVTALYDEIKSNKSK